MRDVCAFSFAGIVRVRAQDIVSIRPRYVVSPGEEGTLVTLNDFQIILMMVDNSVYFKLSRLRVQRR